MQSTVESEDLDEARLLDSLNRVQNMHIQLRNVRETIPCLIQPLHTSHSSPTIFYQDMSRAATTAVKNIQNFQNTMRDVKSKEVLQRAKDSRAQNPDGIRTWEVTEHADWLETRAEVDVKELRIREKSVGEEQLRVEELRTAVEKLNARKGEVLARIEGERMIQVKLSTPNPLEFTIAPYSKPQDGASFTIMCKQTSKLHKSVSDYISTLAKGKNLDYILELLTAYSDLWSRSCSKCQRQLDSRGQFPVARMPSNTKAENQESGSWNAMHIGCF